MLKKYRVAAFFVCLLAEICFPFSRSAQAALIRGDFLPCSSAFSSFLYTVLPGDTLWSIARRHHLSPDALAEENRLSLSTPLTIGQSLHLPETESESDTASYTVQSGDTLWRISQNFSTTCQSILCINPTLSPECLSVGQKIMLPAESNVQIPKKQSEKSGTPGFRWPLSGVITSPFGSRSGETHHGIDIAGAVGDKVLAAADGIVRKVQFHEIYGNMILLEHPDNRQTLYAHLSRMDVSPGETVSQGSVIGAVGSTGRSTGPHLHFEIRHHQIAENPLPYLP